MTKQEYIAMSLGKELILQSPYGFRPNGKESTGIFRLVHLTGDLYADIENKTFPEEFIPVLHPLSDLTKEIEHKGEKFVPIEVLDGKNSGVVGGHELAQMLFEGDYAIWNIKYATLQILLEWKFDIADLISKGEAIDVNTLDINPYK